MPFTSDFKKLLENVEETYLGEKVPKQYRKKYGKRYDKKEMKPLAFAIAKSKKIRIDK